MTNCVTEMNVKKIMLRTVLRKSVIFCFMISWPLMANPVQADTVKANASVTIAVPVSGVTSQSNFSVGVAPSSTSAEADEDLTAPSNETETASTNIARFLEQTSIITPAKFTVFGQSNQVFSVVVPQSVTTSSSDGARITLGSITHSAGATPTLNANGATSFSVGAGVQLNATAPIQATPGVTGINGEGVGNTTPGSNEVQGAEPASDDQETASEGATPVNPASDPFGYLPSSEGFLSVLISYN